MPFQNTTGKPFPRAFDPIIARVQPNGTQPQTVFAPVVVYRDAQGDYQPFLSDPPDYLLLQVLFFGSDYPIKVFGVQQFGLNTYFADSTVLTPLANPVLDAAYPVFTTAPFGGAVPVVPNIVTSTVPVAYQQILRDTTITNGLRVSGFPYTVSVSGRGLYANASGSEGPLAGYGLALDVTLNSSGNSGPGSFTEVVFGELPTAFRLPVILWEPDFDQAVVDASYTITGTMFGVPVTLDVVGLWASDNYSPLPLVGAKLLGAEPTPSPFAALADLRKRAFSSSK